MLWQPGSRRVQHQKTSIGWWRIPIPASSPAEIIHIRFGLIRKRDYSTLHVSHTRVQSNFLWWKNIPHHCLRRGISGYSPHREPLYVLCSLPILGIIISRIQPYILKTRYYTIKCTKNQKPVPMISVPMISHSERTFSHHHNGHFHYIKLLIKIRVTEPITEVEFMPTSPLNLVVTLLTRRFHV